MTGRQVKEWIGRHPDTKVPERLRLRIFMRAGGTCYLSCIKILPGMPWDLEHVIPLSMGGEHRESNLRPALRDHHKAKSAKEAAIRAKADAIAKRNLGITRPKAKIQSRGFVKKAKPPPKRIPPRRALYLGI